MINQQTCIDIPKPRTDERQLWDMISGNIGFGAFLVAYDLQLFPLLSEKPRTLTEVCELLKIHQRPAKALLAMSVSQGLLQIQDEFYALTAFAEDYLLPSSPTYLGDFLNLTVATASVYSFENIKQAVLSNSSQIYSGEKLFQTHQEQSDLARVFTRAIHSRNLGPAQAWPEALDLSAHKLLLDIGGGSGVHAINAILKWPNLQALILDLAPVCEVAQEFIKNYSLQSRIKTQVSDMWSQPFSTADIHFYSDIYHDWPLEKCRFLTQKSFDSLEKGGRIIIHEMLYDDQKNNSAVVAAYDIAMLLWTEGQQYSGKELSTMLLDVGFIDIDVKPTFGYWSIVTGCKP
ncbi:methyltransferase [Anabaena cylindrica FACHB-243]|uniref:O-methyltransferase family 2 n=1 Tax=Anabaena cylindrica (strain ATCC 27899 / PCC 7122) TaxID=272123 RepID=K9ZEN2_ANACC|nr:MULTISPECIES: methyltransferase [Anabaena]AFZ56815.1 O-methyltransferase family 2 [Anabaena cylindrica PCC 7122]MBD2418975.1 methyltransferase [Anabaena cylindrica FACHB-243]MBY5285117.1 methyltransferase [Anabaena sp. CCAP 1446/1C]MBY5308849.1 methyltransferase [Anabaena sp. CCAP 1446/1C]MCM2409492.1 methyltransferase [Anabaena sp. CCAP 1446/1C]